MRSNWVIGGIVLIVLLLFVAWFSYRRGLQKSEEYIRHQSEVIDSLKVRNVLLDKIMFLYEDSVEASSVSLIAARDSISALKWHIVYDRKMYEKKIKDISSFSSDTIYLMVTRWLDSR